MASAAPASTSQREDAEAPTPRDTIETSTDQKLTVPENPSSKPDVKHKDKNGSEATSSSASARVKSGVPASVKQITQHDLGFTASSLAGLNERGSILLGADSRLHMFTFNGQEYSQTLQINLPEWIDVGCFKAVDANNQALIQTDSRADRGRLTTECYNDAGHMAYSLKHEGNLLTSIDHELFYEQQVPGTENDWRIHVHRGTPSDSTSRQEVASTRPVTLQPPAPHRWGVDLSVCRAQDRYCVTEWDTRAFDIFTTEGRHVLHSKLQYDPAPCNAITSCPSGHLLIAENYLPIVIRIHELSGREVGRLYHRDLQLEHTVEIQGLSYSHEDGVLHVCVGGRCDIQALHAYQFRDVVGEIQEKLERSLQHIISRNKIFSLQGYGYDNGPTWRRAVKDTSHADEELTSAAIEKRTRRKEPTQHPQ